jgi:molybdenum cofactor synthesis domain-containing protein
MTTAAGIIIGDEILSGKVRDTNAPLLIDLFRDIGVDLQRMACIGDELGAIAAEVRRTAAAHDVVVTSGGIGPTHDDRTVAGVAQAFDVPVVRDPDLESMIRGFWGPRVNDAALRMADVPRGARLIDGGDGLLPIVAIANVHLLPGIPELFRAKLPTLRHHLSGTRVVLGSLYLRSDESSIAELLGRVDQGFSGIKVGSYPSLHDAGFRLWVTVEGADPGEVGRAIDRLLEGLRPDDVVRVERPQASAPQSP